LLGNLTNRGTVVDALYSYLYIGNGAILSNFGTFDFQTDAPVYVYDSTTPSFVNSGTLKKSGGTGSNYVGIAVTNTGTLRVDSGTLNLTVGSSGAGGRVLSNGATLELSGGTHTLSATSLPTGTGTLLLDGGTVGMAVSATLSSTVGLTMSSGGLSGPGALTVSGAMIWSGGQVANNLTVAVGATLTLTGCCGQPRLFGNLTNKGTVVNTLSSYMYVGNGATLTNIGTFDFQSDSSVYVYDSTTPSFVNSGTLKKSGGTGTSYLGFSVTNTGTLRVDSGTLTLAGGSSGTGSRVLSNGSTLELSGGTHTFGATSVPTGTGTMLVDGGTAAMNANVTVSATVGLTVTNGALSGAGALTVAGAMNWSGGQIANNLTVALGATLSLSGGGQQFSGNLTNKGTVVSTLTSYMYVGNGGTLTNIGTFDFQSDAQVYVYDSTTPSFVNSGTLKKSGGTGTTYLGIVLANTGTVRVDSGELDIVAKGPTLGGSFLVATGSVLGLGGSDVTFSSSSAITGGGGIKVTGGHAVIPTGFSPSTVAVVGGEATFTADISPSQLSISGGTLDGPATVTIPSGGTFTWTGGTLDGAGSTVVAVGATLDMSGCCYRYLTGGRTLRNDGTANFGAYYLYLGSGTTIDNTGTFNFVGDANIYLNDSNAPVPTITNSGTFGKTGGAGQSYVGVSLVNTGTVQVLGGGTLALAGGLSSLDPATGNLSGAGYELGGVLQVSGVSAISSLSAPMTFENPSAAVTDLSGNNLLGGIASIDGAGSFTVENGARMQTSVALTNDGAISVLSGGTVTTGGGLTNDGSVTVGSASSLTSTGTYLQTGGVTTLTDASASLRATGDLVDLEGGVLTGLGTVGPAVVNRATIRPGLGVGVLHVSGDFYQPASGVLEIELGGPPPGQGFDELQVSGYAALGGTITLVTLPDYPPEVGDELLALTYAEESGQFAAVSGAQIGNGVAWNVHYNLNFTSLLATAGQSASSISVNDVTLTEGNSGTKNATFTVTLSQPVPPAGQVQVTYATADGTATGASDYVPVAPTVLTFNPGDSTKSVTVAVNGDLTVEPDETFFVNLTNPAGAALADGQGQATIVNDDLPPSVSIADVAVSEGNSVTKSATFTVTLSSAVPAGGQVQVSYATSDGTATAGSDYVAVAPTVLTFNPGDKTKTVNVSVNGDTVVEANETFFVDLSNPQGATLADNQGQGTIVNDDILPAISISDAVVTEGNSGTVHAAFVVTLPNAVPAGGQVQVTYATADYTASAGSDYVAIAPTTLTFTAGQKSKTVMVTVMGDTVVESNETFTVNLSNPVGATLADNQGQGTIVDDDGGTPVPPPPSATISDTAIAEGNSATSKAAFTVTLSSAVPAGGQVQVSYATADGTAIAGSDYVAVAPTVLTFNPGDKAKSVLVTVNGDTLVEPNETFFVDLSNPIGATLADNEGLGTIVNDEVPQAISITDAVVAEGNSGTVNAVFTVTLPAAVPAGSQVQVTYATADSTAFSGSDYVAIAPTILTFTAGQKSKTVTVVVKGDTVVEPNETFAVNLTNPVGATLADNQGQGTIINDD
jgi:ribosomal protein L35AE/L33A